MEALGIVNKKARLLSIGLCEMVGRNLQRLVDAFADGDRGHHDDELRPAIALVHLEDGLDVAVGFTSARLHFDI